MSSYPFFFFGGLKKISKTKLKNKRIRGDDERIESVGQRSPTIKVCVSCWARELYVIYKRRDSSSCKIYRQSPIVYFFCARACEGIADAFDVFFKKAKRRVLRGLYMLRIPEFRWRKPSHPYTIQLYIYTWASSDNRRIWLYTSVCNFFPPSWWLVCYSTACSTVAHTHSIRQSVCFVTILVSFVRAIKRVSCSFYSNHSILCTHIYLYSIHICIFFPLFFHFDIFLFFFFCLGLLFGLKERVKTEAPNVSDSEWNTKRTWSNSHATTRPTVKVLIFRNFQSSL